MLNRNFPDFLMEQISIHITIICLRLHEKVIVMGLTTFNLESSAGHTFRSRFGDDTHHFKLQGNGCNIHVRIPRLYILKQEYPTNEYIIFK